MATRSMEAVIDVGVLDVMLRVYIRYPTLVVQTAYDSDCKRELLESSQYLLGILVAAAPSVCDHPICSLWVDHGAQSPRYDEASDTNPFSFRSAWRRAPRACAKQQLLIISRGFTLSSGPDIASEVMAYCDLVEFTRWLSQIYFNLIQFLTFQSDLQDPKLRR